MTQPAASVEPSVQAARAVPVRLHERVTALDTLRGFALLGILIMNVQSFAMPIAAYVNPIAYGDLTGANYLVWLLSHLLADQKMMAIFSLLFGAGIVLFTERAAARGRSPARLHYRRMTWLLLFGLAHAYLLWYGDILVLYAVCGFVVYWFRGLAARRLILLGLTVVAVSSAMYLGFGWSFPFWPPQQQVGFIEETWRPPPEQLAAEIAAYRGGWLQQMEHRVPAALEMHTFLLVIWGFWRAAGLMLMGMGLFKLGVLTARAPGSIYSGFIAAGLVVGLPLVGYGVYWNFATGWGPLSLFHGAQFNYWGSLLVSLGWVGVVMLVCQRGVLQPLTRSLAAVGQMAFTNYLLQTLICTTLFYGHGLGWFGQLERTGQIAVVFGVWAFQLLASPLWLRHFRAGPVEWLWRCLTYGKLQPFRRATEPGLMSGAAN